MSLNSVTLSGNATRDAELREGANYSILSFSIAVNERVKNGDNWEDKPSFFNCSMFGKRAAALAPHIAKGTKVCVHGKLRQETWKSNDGSNRSDIKVIVDELELMAPKAKQQQQQDAYADEDVPF